MYVSGLASSTRRPAMRAEAVRALRAPIGHRHAASFCNAIHRQKAGVVRRELILDSRIAQSDNQSHARIGLS